MIRLRHKIFIYALRIFDLAVQFAGLGTLLALTGDGSARIRNMTQGVFGPNDGLGLLMLGLGWMLIFSGIVHYETNRLKTLRTQVIDVTKATTLSAFLLVVVSAIFSFTRVTQGIIVLLWMGTTALSICARIVIAGILMAARRSGYNSRHVLILGYNDAALEMAHRIDAVQVLGYKIVGFIAEPGDSGTNSPFAGGRRILGSFGDLKSILEKGPVDEMIVALPFTEHFATIANAVQLAQELGIVVRFFPDRASAKILDRMHIERFEGECVVTFFREQLLMQLLVKRLMDVALSGIGLVLLSPLLLCVAIAIKLTSPGPVFFVQERIGMNKRRFKLYKFRSMVPDAEARKRELAHLNEMDGPVFKIKKDPRITPIGHFLRRTSIDELPQLFNVLRGQMSLVGPRPPVPSEVEKYEWLYQRRLSIKPGITCLWQISGRNNINFQGWMELDKTYVENWSVWLDLQILVKTVPAVLFGRGAS